MSIINQSCEWLNEMESIQNDFQWRHMNNGRTQLIALYTFVCAFGTIANLIVIIAFIRTPQLHNMRNYFVLNLALSDLMLSIVTAPVTLYLTLNLFWPFGTFTCQLVASFQAINTMCSCFTLVLIAADRFLLTLFPIRWRLAAIAPYSIYSCVWLMSLLLAAPYFFAITAEDFTLMRPWNLPDIDRHLAACNRRRPQICVERGWERLAFSRKTYTLTVLAVQYLLPLAALAFSYARIGTKIRQRVVARSSMTSVAAHNIDRRQALNSRKRRALALLTALVFVYAICWLPINLYNTLNVFDVIVFSQYQYIYCHLVGMTSAGINPLLYGLLNENFRIAIRDLLIPCRSARAPPLLTQRTYSFSGIRRLQHQQPHIPGKKMEEVECC